MIVLIADTKRGTKMEKKETIFICCDCKLISNKEPTKCICGCECFEKVNEVDLNE